MHTQSFHSQMPLFQGFPLPKRKTVCSGAGNTYNWSTLSNAQKKSILDNYILSAQNGDYECLNSWIQIFINSTGQSFGQRVDAQYAGNKKFNLANADVQELIGHVKNRLELSELYIYGSGRLGQTEPNLTLAADAERSFVYNPFTGAEIDPSVSQVPPIYMISTSHLNFVIGQKRYEISNHLGNVSSVITDRKFGVPISGTDPTINYYLADIVTATDYDPYGQALPGRVWNRTGYRFGFNSKETDPEWEIQDYGFRLYDPSIGRFLSIDPLSSAFPWWTPYQFAGCEPIANSDLDGLEPKNETGKSDDAPDIGNNGDAEYNVEISANKPNSGEKRSLGSRFIEGLSGVVNVVTGTLQAIVSAKIMTVPGGQIVGWYGIADATLRVTKGLLQLKSAFTGGAPDQSPSGVPSLAGVAIDAMTDNKAQYYQQLGENAEIAAGLLTLGYAIAKNAPKLLSRSAPIAPKKPAPGEMAQPTMDSPSKSLDDVKIEKEGKVIRIWDGKDGATNKNWNHALDNGLDKHDNWTVICHGKPKYLEPIEGGPGIDPRMLSRILYGNGYSKGEAVTLDCCNTGFLGDFDPEGFSYKLSRLLKAPVTAPTNKVQITAKGTYLVNHPGKMEIINNGKLE